MAKAPVITTIEFGEFYDRNEPESPDEFADLYRSVRDVSEGTYFRTRAVARANIAYEVVAASGDRLLLTKKEYGAFLQYVRSYMLEKPLEGSF